MLDKIMKAKKEKDGEMSPTHKAAKKATLEHLRDSMSQMMKGDLDNHMEGMKKVSVMSPNKEGLSEGLDKAKEMLGSEHQDDDYDNELGDASEANEEENEEHETTDKSPGMDEEYGAAHADQEGEDRANMHAAGADEEAHEEEMPMHELDEMIRILHEKKAKHSSNTGRY